MSLDLNNLSAEEQIFSDALANAGMPVGDDAIKAELQGLADDANLTIANQSKYSAFWCFCSAAIIKPMQYFTAFLIKNVMPNFYVKTAKGAFLDIIAWAYDLIRHAAVKAQGNLLFTRVDSAQQLLIPAGSRVRTIPINGNIYRLITIADAVMDVDVNTLEVACEAESAGAAYNLAVSYYSIMDSDVPGITEVTNQADYLTTAGSNEENDEQLRLRIRNQFAAVGDWHIDAKYKAMIAEQTGFQIDRIFFDHSIPRGPGSADAYILFDAGAASAATLTAINDYIATDGNHGHGDDLVVKEVPQIAHDVSVTVNFVDNVADSAASLLAIENFIRCAFRGNTDYDEHVTQTWPSATFSFSKLDQDLHNYFSEIASLNWGQGDIESNLDIAILGVLTVTEAA